MFPDYCETMPHYKYLCTWRVILLPLTINAIDKTSYAMRQGSSLFTIASARALPPVTSLESGVDVNSSLPACSIIILTLTRKFLNSISTVWLCFRYLEEHEPSGGLLVQTAHRQNLLVS